jgi:hypothetical protein
VADDLSLWSAAGSFRKRLEALVAAGDCRPAFLLALLMAWAPEEIDPGPLGDPAAKAAALAAAGRPIAPVEFRRQGLVATQQQFPQDQAGLDRLAEPHIIGDQQVDPRQIERLGERQKLVGIEPDAGAKGSLEQLSVGCRRRAPFGRSQVGAEACGPSKEPQA